MRHLVFVFTLLMAIPALSNADVYKWTDENGQVHFGDRPTNKKAENLSAPRIKMPPKLQPTPSHKTSGTTTRPKINKPAPINSRVVKNKPFDESQFRQELNRLAQQPSLKNLRSRLHTMKSLEELRISLDWLQKRFMSAKGGSRFSYLYAKNLYLLGTSSPSLANMKDSASMALVAGMLRTRVDANWCKDKTAPGTNIMRWESDLKPILTHYAAMGPAKKNKIINFATRAEEQTSRRGPDAWICVNGMAYFTKFFDKHKDNPNPPITKVDRPDQVGQSHVLHDEDIKPEFVSRSDWQSKRDETVSKFEKWILTYKP